jgi:hypothetical protein
MGCDYDLGWCTKCDKPALIECARNRHGSIPYKGWKPEKPKKPTMMDDIEEAARARIKLKEAAKKGEPVTFSARETAKLDEYFTWLSDERESLISALPDD